LATEDDGTAPHCPACGTQNESSTIAKGPAEETAKEAAGTRVRRTHLRQGDQGSDQAPQRRQARERAHPALAPAPVAAPTGAGVEARSGSGRGPSRLGPSVTGHHGALRHAGRGQGRGTDGPDRLTLIAAAGPTGRPAE